MSPCRELVLRYIERVWNGNDLEALEAMTSETFAYRLGGQVHLDRAGMAPFLAAIHEAFPDWKVEPVGTIAEGDAVAVQWKGCVTHGGTFHGIPATGRRIEVCGINLYRFQDGRIVSEWEQMDTLGMLRQMGVLPA